MYLINYDIFIRQVIPPHWRDQWQHSIIYVLCYPLKKVFDDFYEFRKKTLEEINQNSQVLSMESKLNAIHGFYYREISVTDGATNGVVTVLCPDDEQIEISITDYFEKVKIAGKQLEIINP